MDKKTIPSTELKQHLGDYLGKVQHGGQTFLIEKHGKAVAALVPVASLNAENNASVKTTWGMRWEKLIQDIRKSYKDKNLPTSDAVKFLQEVREEEEERL